VLELCALPQLVCGLEQRLRMPAGVSWPRYISVVAAAFLSMFAGAQTVHHLYNPLQDLEAKVEKEKENLMKVNTNVSADKVAVP
jgi:hypothetical protein